MSRLAAAHSPLLVLLFCFCVLHLHFHSQVFLVDEKGLRHGFPNADTFEAMGFEWGQIHSIPTFVMDTIPLGDPLPKKDFR